MLTLLPFVAAVAFQQFDPRDTRVGRNGSLLITEFAVQDFEEFKRDWMPYRKGAELKLTSRLIVGKPTSINLTIAGCQHDAAGNCQVSVRWIVTDPDGEIYGGMDGKTARPAFAEALPTSNALAFVAPAITIRIDPGEKIGVYKVQALTTDEVAHKSVTTTLALTAQAAE